MKLTEVFNTQVNITWHSQGRFTLGGLVFNGQEYVIQIENKPLFFDELSDKNTAEVSFFKNSSDTEKAHSTTGDVGQPFKLYGAVANSLANQFQRYDAFYFVAESRHSDDANQHQTKIKIYQFLADRLAKTVGATVYKHDNGTRCEWLVSKVSISKTGFIVESTEALNLFTSSGVTFTTVN